MPIVYDAYPHTVKRKTTCLCGKVLPKGTEALMAVLDPGDGFWNKHKLFCSDSCPSYLKNDFIPGGRVRKLSWMAVKVKAYRRRDGTRVRGHWRLV